MPRQSRASRENLQPVVYRFTVKGPVPPAVIAEVRRAHILRNKQTEVMRSGDDKIAELHAAQPAIAAAQEAADQAAQHVRDLMADIQKRKAAGRTRQPDPALTKSLAEARTARDAAREHAKTVKTAERAALKKAETAIRDKTDAALKSLYRPATSGTLFEETPLPVGGVYWATFNMVAEQQRLAEKKVISRRVAGLPAQLSYRRWDGSGTIALQLQRAANDPPRTPAVLADAECGKWRNVLLLQPGRTEAEWAALPPCERKVAQLRFRIGSGAAESSETLRFVMHRPIPDDADVVSAQVTLTRVTSTRLRGAVALTVNVRAPEPKAGGPVVAVHTGWRALDDGAIRVAVITGAASPPPAGMGAMKDPTSARRRLRARRRGNRSPVDGRPWAGGAPLTREFGIRDHGWWQEVVIPPGARDLAAHADSIGGIRDRLMNDARKVIAAYLEEHPDAKEQVDPRGALARWRSPGRFRAALKEIEVATTGATPDPWPGYKADRAIYGWQQAQKMMEVLGDGTEEARALRTWATQDTHLELWEAHESRKHFYGWRTALYRDVAAWLATGAGVIVMDSWSAARRKPDASEEDTQQMEAARANAALAAPGDLRLKVKVAATRRGAEVRGSEPGLTRVHFKCGGNLSADERTRGIRVTCDKCGRHTDQDLNAARAMQASGGVVPASPGEAPAKPSSHETGLKAVLS